MMMFKVSVLLKKKEKTESERENFYCNDDNFGRRVLLCDPLKF